MNTLVARVYHALTIVQPSHLPRNGPGIVVCNHISPIDPILIQSACRDRLITWMMAKEYMELPVLGRVFKLLDVIPVDRGSRETGPLRAALRHLKDGRVIGIFPEGKISTNNQLLDFQTGVALMALRARVPVFPAYLDGTQRNKTMGQAFLQRSSSQLCFGPALVFDHLDTSKQSVDQATAEIKAAIEILRNRVDESRRKM